MALIADLNQLGDKEEKERVKLLTKYFKHDDYLVRSKAFAMACDYPHPDLMPALTETIHEEQAEEFRLRAIEALQKLGTKEALAELAKLLKDPNPLIVRGAVVAIGGISSPEAVRTILEFASSPQGRIVRSELVEEAVSFALQDIADPQELLTKLAEENANIRRYLRNLTFERPAIPHFKVYPSSDYFALQAKERGIDYKVYKYLIG